MQSAKTHIMTYLSTSRLSRKLGIDPPELYEKLLRAGLLGRKGNDWCLTELGRNYGGQVRTSPTTGEFVVWPSNINTTAILKEDSSTNGSSRQVDDKNLDDLLLESEGEDYIADYFDAIDVNYREQHIIKGLKGDDVKYRMADFYLPDYNVVVEFAGRWNRSKEDRARYNKKRAVYERNNIRCIWLYPDNLGILHYIFHRRLEGVLCNFGAEKELRKYRIAQGLKAREDNIWGLLFGLATIVWLAIARIFRGKPIEISRLNKWED